MSTAVASTTFSAPTWLQRHHGVCLATFTFVVLAHWAEHVTQAVQIFVLGWQPADARGVLGIPFPWLVTTEGMHYGYAIVMLVMLWALRCGFEGAARQWWMLAFGLQFWHHIEHFLLLVQASTGLRLAGEPVPTSIVQLFVPRVELHLFYNAVVTIPMLVAVVLHQRQQGTPRRAAP